MASFIQLGYPTPGHVIVQPPFFKGDQLSWKWTEGGSKILVFMQGYPKTGHQKQKGCQTPPQIASFLLLRGSIDHVQYLNWKEVYQDFFTGRYNKREIRPLSKLRKHLPRDFSSIYGLVDCLENVC